MLNKDSTAPLSLKEVSSLLQRSTEQAFNASSQVTKSASSPLTARYAHFTLTVPLLNANHTPVEISKGSNPSPLTLALDTLYVQLTTASSDALKEAPTSGTASHITTAPVSHTEATATISTHDATEPCAQASSYAAYAAAPTMTQAPARVHFIYRLREDTDKAPQKQSTTLATTERGARQITVATRPARADNPAPTPTPCHAKLQRLYINGVRVLWKE